MRVRSKEMIVAAILGLLLGGSIAIGSQLGFAAAVAVAVLPIVILVRSEIFFRIESSFERRSFIGVLAPPSRAYSGERQYSP